MTNRLIRICLLIGIFSLSVEGQSKTMIHYASESEIIRLLKERKIDQAVSLIEKEIKQGNIQAPYNVGYELYYVGVGYLLGTHGLSRNESEGVRLLEKAVEIGSLEALEYLALIYEHGDGVEKNIDKAIQYYQHLITVDQERRYSRANEKLAILYLNQNKGQLAVEVLEALDPVKDAGAWDSSRITLASIYREGKAGVVQNNEKVFEIYRLYYGWNRSSPLASFQLAQCYEQGIGTEKDLLQAKTLYQETIQRIEKGYGGWETELDYSRQALKRLKE